MGQRLDNAKALYLEAIRDGHPVEAITKYSGDRYVQHSTPVKDGRDGFIEFFGEFLERNPNRQIEIVRGFEDGQYVFLHVVQTLNHGEFRYVTADIFDTDDNAKMIEHWDIIQEMVDETVSGHSQVDGPTEPTDLSKTEDNKALVRKFIDDVLVNGRFDRVTDYISSETYIQHNPQIADGLDGLAAFVKQLSDGGGTMQYQKVHNVIGCGNFVVSLSKMMLSGAGYAVIDVFRVQNDRLVEHWDVMEKILPAEQWVNGGKF